MGCAEKHVPSATESNSTNCRDQVQVISNRLFLRNIDQHHQSPAAFFRHIVVFRVMGNVTVNEPFGRRAGQITS